MNTPLPCAMQWYRVMFTSGMPLLVKWSLYITNGPCVSLQQPKR